MVMIQIDLTENENQIVELYKAVYNLKTKEETVKDMIHRFEARTEYGKIRIIPRLKK